MEQNTEHIKLYEEMMELKIKYGEYKDFPSFEDYYNEQTQVTGWKKLKRILFKESPPTYREYELIKMFYEMHHKSPGPNISETSMGGLSLTRPSEEDYIHYFKSEIERLKLRYEKNYEYIR